MFSIIKNFNPMKKVFKKNNSSYRFLNNILVSNGIMNSNANIFFNLNYDEIRKHEEKNMEGIEMSNGVFSIDTGEFTGRSPKDKYIVKNNKSSNFIDWGKVNQPMEELVFEDLENQVKNYYSTLDKIYVFDCYACHGDKNIKKKIRFITHYAFQHHFVKNMFFSYSTEHALNDKTEPDFTIINASNLKNPNWKEQKLNSENFVAINLEKKLGLIGGTSYTGENKKMVFTLYNYWMPLENKVSLHCGASVNNKNETILFLGLSGTGKTSLSTMDGVNIIGDDEHVYYGKNVVNIENGNYAKCAKLSAENEPVIYNAIKHNALVENVWINPISLLPDYNNITKTENSRVSYPMQNVPKSIISGTHDNVKRMVFLTCDAYSILPRISILNTEEAIKYFLIGYTSKLAGTERGINKPEPTFSSCFGAAFMVHRPIVYAELLRKQIEENNLKIYLLNTGWHGGPEYLGGHRVDMKITLEITRSIYDGDIDNSPTVCLNNLGGLIVPTKLKSLGEDILIPWNSWKSIDEYNIEAKKLMDLFDEETKKYV